jgi:hypothetical protein
MSNERESLSSVQEDIEIAAIALKNYINTGKITELRLAYDKLNTSRLVVGTAIKEFKELK